jgi:hypothetical protein
MRRNHSRTILLVVTLLGLTLPGVTLLVAAQSAGQAGSSGTATDDIVGLQHRYMSAMVKQDMPDLEKILAADYLSVAATGLVLDRAKTLGYYRSNRLQKAFVDELNVRFYGDTAVVIGRYDQLDNSGPWSGRFTAIWVRHGDTWQIVSEHFCKLP